MQFIGVTEQNVVQRTSKRVLWLLVLLQSRLAPGLCGGVVCCTWTPACPATTANIVSGLFDLLGFNAEKYPGLSRRMNDIAYLKAADSLRRGYQAMVFVHSRKDTGEGSMGTDPTTAAAGTTTYALASVATLCPAACFFSVAFFRL